MFTAQRAFKAAEMPVLRSHPAKSIIAFLLSPSLPPANTPALHCNDSHYHIVIANTPASSQLVPKTHLHVVKYSFVATRGKRKVYNWPEETTVGTFSVRLYGVIYLQIHTVCICVMLIIYVLSLPKAFLK